MNPPVCVFGWTRLQSSGTCAQPQQMPPDCSGVGAPATRPPAERQVLAAPRLSHAGGVAG